MDFEDDDGLPPLPQMRKPSSPRRVRRQPRFSRDTAVASPTVPSPGANQVIATLIDSLTTISQDGPDQLKLEFQTDSPTLDSDFDVDRPQSPDSFYADIPRRHSSDPTSPEDCDTDGDVAAAPVIRLARAPPEPYKKKTQNPKSRPHLTAMYSDPSLSVRSSMHSLRSDGDAEDSMGVPSIERPNASSTSVAGSTLSARSPAKASFSEPEPEPLKAQTPLQAVLTPRSSSIRKGGESRPRFSFEEEGDKENTDLRVMTGFAQHLEPITPQSQNSDIHAASPLNSVLNRGDLGEHLIPSRRSSIRRSTHSTQSEPHDAYRHSMGGRDLKDLNIDDELIGSDDSTVRRIRELQEARERRQQEWHKEARRSLDKPGKRYSAPSPKAIQRSSIYQSSKLSVTEVLVESDQEASPDVSARVDASDLASMPALVPPTSGGDSLTPRSQSPMRRPSLQRSAQSTPTPAVKSTSSHVQRGSRPSSISIKRSSTVSSKKRDTSMQNDVKSIQEEVDAFLNAPRLTQKIRHPRTGRTIAFSEVGDPNGFVVFCCVGMGLTRYVMSFYDELARTLKLRLITPDRPGVGESEGVPERLNNPLTWVDDVAVICSALEIRRFSLLAHSAGSIYALATALKMPQFVRGRIHLLAPWIPPSQMPKGAAIGPDSQPVANLPMTHRILSVLPAPILRVANSKFLSATSASVEVKPLKSKKLRNIEGLDVLDKQFVQSYTDLADPSLSEVLESSTENESSPSSARARSVSCYQATNDSLSLPTQTPGLPSKATPSPPIAAAVTPPRLSSEARTAIYNSTLTHRIWSLATLNANPAIDLMICLERRRTIGFRYAEVTRSVVIRHGAKDSRVPLDNVRWLHSIMKRCELRVLEGEGHSLMASAGVMSSVLTEIAKEWDEWERIARDKEKRKVGENSGTKENKARSLRSLGTISVRS